MLKQLLRRGVATARGVVSAGRGFFEGQHGVGYGVAEFEDLDRLRREAREQDAREGNPEAAGAELESIADGTREIGAEDLRVQLEVEEGPDRPYVIDVRTPKEWATARIPGAHYIPLKDLESRLAEVPRGRRIVACGGSWTGGVDATYVLKRGGFAGATALAGGFDAWLEIKGPIEKG